MKAGVKEITVALLFISSLAAANDGEGRRRREKIDHPLMTSSPVCKPFHEVFVQARDGDRRAEDQTIKVAELPKVVTALRDINAASTVDREKLIAQVNAAKSFDELGNTLMQNTSQRCFPERLNILRTLLETMRTKKISAPVKKDVVEAIRAHFLSDINMSMIGIRVNSGMAALACSKKIEKDLSIKCEGLQKYMDDLRVNMRESFRDGMKETRSFTFFGRILYYWDKWVNKKSGRDLDGNLDRYFDYRPFQKHILDEFEGVKKSREEFEKFII